MIIDSNFQGIQTFVFYKSEISFLFWRVTFKEVVFLKWLPYYIIPYLGISWNEYKGIWLGFWNKLIFIGIYKNRFQIVKSKINKDGYIQMLFVKGEK